SFPASRVPLGERTRHPEVRALEWIDALVPEAELPGEQVLVREESGEWTTLGEQRPPVDGEVHRTSQRSVVLEERPIGVEDAHPQEAPGAGEEPALVDAVLLGVLGRMRGIPPIRGKAVVEIAPVDLVENRVWIRREVDHEPVDVVWPRSAVVAIS